MIETLRTIYYVSDSGDDGESGLSPALAKGTITAAKTVASSGDLIVVGPGNYNERDLVKNGVDYHFESGAILNYTGTAGPIFDSSSAVKFRVSGNGRFQHSGSSGSRDVVRINNAGSIVHFECDEIVSNGRGIAVGAGFVYAKVAYTQTADGSYDVLSSTARFFGECDYIFSEVYAVEMDGGYIYLKSRHIQSDANPIENQAGSILVDGANIIAGSGEPISVNVDRVTFTNCTFESDLSLKFTGSGSHTFISSPVNPAEVQNSFVTSSSPMVNDFANMITGSGTDTPSYKASALVNSSVVLPPLQANPPKRVNKTDIKVFNDETPTIALEIYDPITNQPVNVADLGDVVVYFSDLEKTHLATVPREELAISSNIVTVTIPAAVSTGLATEDRNWSLRSAASSNVVYGYGVIRLEYAATKAPA